MQQLYLFQISKTNFRGRPVMTVGSLRPPAGLTAILTELGVDATVVLTVELYVRVARVRLVLTVRSLAHDTSVVVSVRTVRVGGP